MNAAPGGVDVRELAYDTRDVVPGHALLLRARARRATGTRSRRPPPRSARPRSSSSTRSTSRCRSSSCRTSARRCRRPRRSSSATRRASSTSPAITGTNGKTTTAFLLHAILEADGRRPGLLTNIERRVGGESRPTGLNTPEAIDLQRLFRADGSTRGDRACVMEATSIAQAQGRLDGHAVRGARLHEPDAGSPRLPRHDGGVLRGEARACSTRPSARWSTSATSTAGGSRPSCPTRSRSTPTRTRSTGSSCGCRGRFNRENAIGAALAARALGVERRRDPARDRVGRRRARAGSSRSTRGSRSR